jgi:FkbM family methyltransferase
LEYNRDSLKSEGYFSQSGQDKWVSEKILPHLKEGVFVDVGAHDGVSLSNTFFFERLGWKGIAIEPNPSVFRQLENNRSCKTINVGIANADGTGVFRVIEGYSNMLSGFVDAYDERHLSRIECEIAEHGGSFKDINVEFRSLDKLLAEHGVEKIDYLSVDVEGLEMKILESMDFDRIKVLALSVENNYKDYRLPKMLCERGFKLHAMLGDDNIFVSRNL